MLSLFMCIYCLIMCIITKSLKKSNVNYVDCFRRNFTFYNCKYLYCLYLFTNVKKINVTFVN